MLFYHLKKNVSYLQTVVIFIFTHLKQAETIMLDTMYALTLERLIFAIQDGVNVVVIPLLTLSGGLNYFYSL